MPTPPSNGNWSVETKKIVMSANEEQGPTKYTIDLHFAQQSTNAQKNLRVDIDGSSKVPGGVGLAGPTLVRIFKLNSHPTIVSTSTTQPDPHTKKATVTLEMVVDSQRPPDRAFTEDEAKDMRLFDLNDGTDLAGDSVNKIKARFDGDKTHLTFTFPITLS